MVREIRSKPLSKRLQSIALSPYILPFLTLAFITLTLPVIYLTTQQEQDVRQQAATIATNSIVINTDEASYREATTEALTNSTITISGLSFALVLIAVTATVVIVYRRKISSF